MFCTALASVLFSLCTPVVFSRAVACLLLTLSYSVRINKTPVVTHYMGLFSSLYRHQEHIPHSADRVQL